MAAEITTLEKEEKPETNIGTNIEEPKGRRIDQPDETITREDGRLDFLKLLKQLKAAGEKTSKVNRAFALIQSNSITLRNLVVAASTYGLERLLNAKAFNCPEKSYQPYGFAFLFAPVVILFCINLLVIGEIWKLSSRMYVKRYRRRGDCVARVLPSILKACVGPAVWLIVAFLEEDYYVCAKLGPVTTSSKETSERAIVECKSQSHVLAWTILVGLVILGTAMIVWMKCFLKDNLLIDNLYEYERREALGAMKAFTEHMGASCKDADLDNDPLTGEYGSEEEKVTLYHEGVPEIMGKRTVGKLFEGYKGENWTQIDKWHYIKAYKAFKEMYPRICTGSPRDPWRVVQGDIHDKRTQETCRVKCLPTCFQMTSSWDELEPLHLDEVAPRNKITWSEPDDTRESEV